MKYKPLILILTAMLMTQTVSCEQTGEVNFNKLDTNPTDSGDTTVSETEYIDTLPIVDFKGTDFVIIGQSYNARQNFYLDEKTGDVCNDALYDRDLAVIERLNVNLVYESRDDRSVLTTDVQKSVLADDEAYHLVMNSLSGGINTLTFGNLLYDLQKLPYLSLSSSLWNASILENMTFNGSLFFTTGPISLQYFMTPIAMMMNNRLAEDYSIPNIYKTVLDGDWTLDLLHSYIKDVASDLNSDGKMDNEDFYGLIVDGTFGNVLYNSSGYNNIDDNYTLLLDSDLSVEIIDKVTNMFGSRDNVFNDRMGEGTVVDIFKEGRAIFMDHTILGISNMRDMEDDFSIIPTPKYDETQSAYLTTCNTWLPSGVCVPKYCSDPERTGLVTETMAYYSELYLTPATYEVTLKGKVARDDNSSLMLDLIYENAYFDMVTVFNFNDTATLLRDAALGEVENFASRYAATKATAQATIDNIIAEIEG